jgi:hypothetical protein
MCHNLKTIDLPNSITFIGSGAFNFTGLSIFRFPDSVKFFSSLKSLFQGCKNLTTLDLNNVEDLTAPLMCAECTNLHTIYMSKIKKIWGFEECSSLSTIYCNNPTPPVISFNAIHPNAYHSAIVYVPVSAVQTYKTNYDWSQFWNIRAITQ